MQFNFQAIGSVLLILAMWAVYVDCPQDDKPTLTECKIAGNRWQLEWSTAKDGTVRFFADGTYELSIRPEPRPRTYYGMWWIKGNDLHLWDEFVIYHDKEAEWYDTCYGGYFVIATEVLSKDKIRGLSNGITRIQLERIK